MADDRRDVIGLALDDARRRLESAGIRIAGVRETRPPRSGVQFSGPLRVVAARPAGPEAVELVVTPEHYDPATLGGRAAPGGAGR